MYSKTQRQEMSRLALEDQRAKAERAAAEDREEREVLEARIYAGAFDPDLRDILLKLLERLP